MDEKDKLLSKAWREADHPAPAPEMDARILAAARKAVARPKSPIRRSWLRFAVPVSAAAVMLLAVGVALLVEKDPHGPAQTLALNTHQEQADYGPAAEKSMSSEKAAVRMAESKQQEQQAPVVADVAPLSDESSLPTAATQSFPAAQSDMGQEAKAERAMAAPPLKSAAPASEAASPVLQNEAERAAGPTLGATETARRLDSADAEMNQELVRIRQLIRDGNTAEARRRLAELQKRHPNFQLPEDLRAFAPSP